MYLLPYYFKDSVVIVVFGREKSFRLLEISVWGTIGFEGILGSGEWRLRGMEGAREGEKGESLLRQWCCLLFLVPSYSFVSCS